MVTYAQRMERLGIETAFEVLAHGRPQRSLQT